MSANGSANLTPYNKNDPESVKKARENGRKGGIRSGIAKREKRTFRELVNICLSEMVTNSQGRTESKKMVMMINLTKRAVNGDLKAMELLMKVQGEMSERIEVTGKDGKDLNPKIEVEIIDKTEDVNKEANEDTDK